MVMTEKSQNMNLDIENGINDKNDKVVNNSYNNILMDKEKELNNLNYCLICYVVTFSMPLIVCDLYFGFSNDDCLTKYSRNLNFKLKTYLLVSGFLGLIVVIIYIIVMNHIKYIKFNEEENLIVLFCGIILHSIIGIFSIIWNILGAVLFWDYIYPNRMCNSQLSTYLFVSLIIKLIGSLSLLKSNNNDDD